LRLIIEYDGRRHAEDSRQWLTDIFRREELDQMRWRLVIVTSEGIYRDPLRTLVRVRDALWSAGQLASTEPSSRSGNCTSQSANASRPKTANVCRISPINTREPS
jgi:hypothetical protein